MASEKVLTLEDFRAKAIKKHNERKKVADIEVAGYGLIRFTRPSEEQLLSYMDNCAKAIVTAKDEETGKNVVVDQDLALILEASKELVYSCCPFLQDNELREELGIKDPLDTPVSVFGINTTMEIAGMIADEFEGEKVEKEVKEEIKN